jgi:hypothetical protein
MDGLAGMRPQFLSGVETMALMPAHAPAVQLLPFPVGQMWLTEVAGKTVRSYHAWMPGTFLITMAGLA